MVEASTEISEKFDRRERERERERKRKRERERERENKGDRECVCVSGNGQYCVQSVRVCVRKSVRGSGKETV